MAKIYTRVHHKDTAQDDHAHKLPNGTYTGGMLNKPNSDREFPHTHLYQHNGDTLESSLAPIGGDHTHVTECGVTSGPVPVRKDAQQDVTRGDSVTRDGAKWIVKSETGKTLGRFDSQDEAKKFFQG